MHYVGKHKHMLEDKIVLKINNRVSAKFIPVNFGFFHQTCLLGTNTLINFFDFFPPDMLIWVGMFIRHSRVHT